MANTRTTAEIAEHVGGALEGCGDAEISGLANLRDAQSGDITFVTSPKYAGDAAKTEATAALVKADWSRPCPAVLIRVEDPDVAFAKVAALFAPELPAPAPGVHDSAVVADDAVLGDGVSVGPLCVVAPGARIGDRTILQAGCYLGPSAAIGADCLFYPHVSIREYVQVADRVIIHDGAVIGSDGFGYWVDDKGERTKIPQIGIVEVCDDVEIGANVTIDRARFGKTRIGKGAKIDNLVQIAHNVTIGDHAVIVAQVGIAGSTEVGEHAILAGQVGVAGHLKIGAYAAAGAQSGVWRDIPAKTQVFGYPALPQKEAMSLQRHYMKLPQLKARVAELEKRLEELEGKV